MKRPVIVGTILLVVVLLFPASPETRASNWVDHWKGQFQHCRSLADIRALPKSERPDLIITQTFPDHTWVAVVSESTCMVGFDATVFYDSQGRIQSDRSHHFCGYEGLSSELSRISAGSLNDFYAALPQCHLVEL